MDFEHKMSRRCSLARPLRQLNKIAKRPALDLEFENLEWAVRDDRQKDGFKRLLNGIHGKFCCGQLSAIMGPSGAGKSTLLNILAGYVTAGVKGNVRVNDEPRDSKLFNKLSCYIMQEDLVQPNLSVQEAMGFAADVKLSGGISHRTKLAVIDEVIHLLGLEKCLDIRTEHLSGGQRKRLAIALELVNNPPVIFLDEPTTGLDNFAIKQCMDLLQKITKIGRTVICTIHQPPSSVFHAFDQVYIIANGFCVYNGSPAQLVPFLAATGYPCPPNNTPADYIIELVHLDPSTIQPLSFSISNGRNNFTNDKTGGITIGGKPAPFLPRDSTDSVCSTVSQAEILKVDTMYPTSSAMQFRTLTRRMFLQMRRNKTMLSIQTFHHIFAAVLVGSIFFGLGNNGAQTFAVFKFVLCINFFFMYTYVFTPVLLFPLEFQLLRREYFNRWYGLKPYFFAMTLASLPLLIIFGTLFTFIVYLMSSQPLEIDRFLGFCLTSLVMGVCSQGLGYAIGSICSITAGSVVGPAILAATLTISCYGMGYRESISSFMTSLMSTMFMRHGLVATGNVLFTNRGILPCPEEEIYCHYKDPKYMMLDAGIPTTNYLYPICAILLFSLVFRTVSYVILKYRLRSIKDSGDKITFYVNKYLKRTTENKEA